MGQDIIENVAADIIEKHIDGLIAQGFEPLLNIFIFIINGGVIADLVNQPFALLWTARDTNGAASAQLGNLSDNGPCCPRRAGDNDGVARFGTANIQKPK